MRILLGGILVACILLTSCRDDYFYSKSYDFDNYRWDVEDVKEFTFEVTDTSASYLWFVDVRHTADFEFANFYVFPKRIAPNGKVYTDTLNIPLANPAGEWYGSGLGDLVDNRVLWKKNVKFPQEGKYLFQFEQGSRETQLEGIVNIGFSIFEN
ncbi:MAG: gliding motility lipoprotein GldH [Flavobacteriales bacterium]